MTTKYYCSACGSTQILYNVWCAYNPEDMPEDWDKTDSQDDFCLDCMEYTTITDTAPAPKTPKGFGESS